MIHTLYDHGDEKPATGLALPQLRAARLDAAGVLWVDLDGPTDEEISSVLLGVFELHPAAVPMFADGGGSAGPIDLGGQSLLLVRSAAAHETSAGAFSGAQRGTLAVFVGANYVVTAHADPWPPVAALRDSAARGDPPLARGSDRLAADILVAIARFERDQLDAAAAALARLVERAAASGDLSAEPRLAAARLHARALSSEIAQIGAVARSAATEPLPAVRPANRLYFAAVGHALAGLGQQADVLADAADEALAGERALRMARALQTRQLRVTVLLAALVAALVAVATATAAALLLAAVWRFA